MKRFSGLNLFAALFLISAVGTVAWATESLENLGKQTDTAAKEANDAAQEAKDNIPKGDAKAKEDSLDQAARKNEETPAGNKDAKQKSEKAENDAQNAADGAAKGDPDKAKAYRAALKKRRDAHAKLRNICAQLAQILQARRRFANDTSDIDPIIKKCREAFGNAEKVITAALVIPGNGLPAGQEYVVRPRDLDSPDCYVDAACADALSRRDEQLGIQRGRNAPPPLVPAVPNVPRGGPNDIPVLQDNRGQSFPGVPVGQPPVNGRRPF